VTRLLVTLVLALTVFTVESPVFAQAPVVYQLSFPDRAHRLLDVDVTFTDVPPGPLQLRMSRSSPGRYAIHEFAKNVFDVRVEDGDGRALRVTRPDPHGWNVPEHGPIVRVRYRVFGDRVDGTYLAVDSTHAHINMPAALMWARGYELRPVSVRFETPAASAWKVATQLFPGGDAQSYTAPTLQYLMDSPVEVSAFSTRTFSINDGANTPTFRLSVHHTGTDAELESLTRDAERLVREARNVFREFPAFDTNTYSFIGDWIPSASSDAMEHRNSTIITGPRTIRSGRADLLDSMAHEFFHAWNVERIRPRSLEPFNLDDQNISGELWLAEGFTNYYGPLILQRAGLTGLDQFVANMGAAINTVVTSAGRTVRTVEQMSQMAAFTDAATAVDPTSFDNTFVSYYTWGSVIGLGLDLTLRVQTDHRVTLDDLMRALWQKFGKPGGRLTGYVDTPYTGDDVRQVLGEVSGDQAFADEFFRRFIQGHELVDYESLLARAGLSWRRVSPGSASMGLLRIQDGAVGVRLAGDTPMGSPAYVAGLDRDDVIVALGNVAVRDASGFLRALSSYKPGQRVPVSYERHGERQTTTVLVEEDPRRELVPLENSGGSLTDAQRRFRDAWLSSAARNSF
jgi:predicted metalloprotease with PDZ domain